MTTQFPDTMDFRGYNAPSRIECDIYDLVVEGKIPDDLMGTMVRWTFDLSKPGDGFEVHDLGPLGDFPRVAEKDHMVDYDIGYYQFYDPEQGD